MARLVSTLLLALAWSAALATAAIAQALSPQAFRDAYAAEIHRQLPKAIVKVLEEQALEVVREPGGEPVQVYTGNAYALYKQDPSALQEVVQKYVKIIVTSDRKELYDPQNLRVVVRPTDYLQLLTRPDKPAPFHRPIAGDLVLLLAIDSPESIAVPPSDEIQSQLKMDEAALWALALKNTRVQLPKRLDLAQARPVILFVGDDGYGSSLLAIDEVWRDVDSQKVPVLVAPVEKNSLVVFRGAGPKELKAMRDLVKAAEDSPDRLSQTILTRREGKWVVAP